MSDAMLFDAAKLRRYDRPGPRYTSYPTAPQFDSQFTEQTLREEIARINAAPLARRLSLYVHVPYCFSPCFYCGCNRVITRDRSRARPYLERLKREISMLGGLFDRDHEAVQVHLGGGTPNFMRPGEISELIATLGNYFFLNASAGRDFSIELDPRHVAPADIAEYARRFQPRQPRRPGFRSGSAARGEPYPERRRDAARHRRLSRRRLPLRQRRSDLRAAAADDRGILAHSRHRAGDPAGSAGDLQLRASARNVQSAAADRTAHLPDSEAKLALLALAVEKLSVAGYRYIGMDHFALPGDDLARRSSAARCSGTSWVTPRTRTAT